MAAREIVRSFSLLSRSRVLPTRAFAEGPGTVRELAVQLGMLWCALYRISLLLSLSEHAIPDQEQDSVGTANSGELLLFLLPAYPGHPLSDPEKADIMKVLWRLSIP